MKGSWRNLGCFKKGLCWENLCSLNKNRLNNFSRILLEPYLGQAKDK